MEAMPNPDENEFRHLGLDTHNLGEIQEGLVLISFNRRLAEQRRLEVQAAEAQPDATPMRIPEQPTY